MMKTSLALTVVLLGLIAVPAGFAGPESISSKEMKQTAVQPECWYRDNEVNVSLWGAYAFSGNDDRPDIEDVDDLNDVGGNYDRFMGNDAWGGGIDVKYFFHRYFGLGVEGIILNGDPHHAILDHGTQAEPEEHYQGGDNVFGGVLGTFTVRFPIGCSRFAPYVWAGGGWLWDGRDDHAVGHDPFFPSTSDHFEDTTVNRGAGQFGAGIEVRVTRHIGFIGDFSWNVLDGPHNNFGMVRSGVNFAF
jgi:hypothetical protein